LADGRFSNLEFDERGRQGRQPAADDSPTGKADHFVSGIRDAQHYLRQAEAQELADDPEAALRSFAAALGEDPLLLEAWAGQVRMLIELEEYPEARLWADKALEKFPDNPALLALKSVALRRMGSHTEAWGLNDVALQGKGDWALVWACRGELMLADRRPAAEQCFARAQSLAPNTAPMMMRIGAIYLRYHKYSQALDVLQKAAASLPQAARVWYLLGRAQEELALSGQARVSYEQARRLATLGSRCRNAHVAAGLTRWLRKLLRRLFLR
jgi:tetratricopeptide (TPR) repeat protein